MSLLSLLENIDSEYISIEELLNEILLVLGSDKTEDDALSVLTEMLRREKEFSTPIIYYKDLTKCWTTKLPPSVLMFNQRYTQSLNILEYLENTGADLNDLSFWYFCY